jgi:hypothetical protein
MTDEGRMIEKMRCHCEKGALATDVAISNAIYNTGGDLLAES